MNIFDFMCGFSIGAILIGSVVSIVAYIIIGDLDRMNNAINEITILDKDKLEIFKAVLIDRFIRLRSRYNFELKKYSEENTFKKFFAFKENDITKLSVKEIFEKCDNIEKILKDVIAEDNIPLDCMEFNFPLLENLHDKETCTDLVRGLFLYRRSYDN